MKKLLLLLVFIPLNPLFCQEFLDLDIWVDAGYLGYQAWEGEDWVYPARPDSYVNSDRTEDLYRTLKKETAYLLSAMIYGWEFRYDPPDLSAGVDEFYQLQLKGQVSVNSERLEISDSWNEDRRYYIHISYWLSPTERRRLSAHQSNLFPNSGGRGSASPFGEIPRQESLEKALIHSIRNYLRPIERNRPRSITGTIYLRQPPIFTLGPASYICQVMVKLDLDPLVEYP